MRIAVSAGYWSSGPPPGTQELFEAADHAGVDQIWTAEAYGSDAWTPLAWWGSRTSRIQLGTAVSQLSARPPVTLAMTAMTMDHLTQGRILLGIGTSNPQVVEGWYGQPYPRPLERTREYIDIVRQVIARREPVRCDGKHYQLPLPPEHGSTGLGKPLRSILHPYRTEIPIYLGAEGPKNVALAAEIADGWNVIALYIGGMGARGVNFHHEVFVRMGYEAEARQIQDLYLAGDRKSAIAAVPTALVEDVALIGPWAKIADEIQRWKQTVLTTFSVHAHPSQLTRIADLVR